MPPASTHPAPPQHCPAPRELDDLELILTGGLDPSTGFNDAGSAVTLVLPADIESAAVEAGAVELVDPEGLPLARAAWPSGPVEPLSRPEHGPFRRLYLSPAEVRERHAGRAVVPLWSTPSNAEVARLQGEGPLLLLALVGHGVLPDAAGLLRAALTLADLLDDAEVVAVPLARREDHSVADRVLAAYGVPADRRFPPLAPAIWETDPLAPTRTHPALARAAGEDRQPGVVLFFTGLSGSGKSTLAQALMDRVLEGTTRSITSLDGDVVRRNLSKGLTFSREDRETNILRIGWVAAEISRHGGLAVCSPIAPFDGTRKRVRDTVEQAGGRFFLVHVATPLEECERRDRKGLYAKARAGEIPDFTGISSPYEEPEDADVVVDTTGRSIEDALGDVLERLGPVVPEVVGAAGLDTGASAPYSTTERDLAGRVAAEERGGVSRPTPEDPLRILFVCAANICRSPYMEAAARAHLAGRDVEVASAGVRGLDARPTDEAMAAQMRQRGFEDPSFRSRPVTRRLVEAADVVLTAESGHRSLLLEEHPEALRKIFTLGQLATFLTHHDTTARGRELVDQAGRLRGSASPDLDVADPYRQGEAAAAAAARHIDDLLAVVLPALAPESDPGKG